MFRRNRACHAGDLETAVATAQAIGDDRLQQAAQGVAVPDSFTHGSSAQRVQWLSVGMKSGEVDSCTTPSRGRPKGRACAQKKPL
jgi:predicted metalloprotease